MSIFDAPEDLGPLSWEQCRVIVLARPLNGRCEMCGEVPATDGHHRRRRSQGGPNTPDNVAAVCRRCHGWIHANPAEAEKLGYICYSGTNWSDTPLVLWTTERLFLDRVGSYCYAP